MSCPCRGSLEVSTIWETTNLGIPNRFCAVIWGGRMWIVDSSLNQYHITAWKRLGIPNYGYVSKVCPTQFPVSMNMSHGHHRKIHLRDVFCVSWIDWWLFSEGKAPKDVFVYTLSYCLHTQISSRPFAHASVERLYSAPCPSYDRCSLRCLVFS